MVRAGPTLRGEGHRLFLVSCVKTKRRTTAPAKDLYVSDWFRKARTCVEGAGGEWRIPSAEYGAVHPDDGIPTYERTLHTMPKAERCAWARGVLESIETDPLRACSKRWKERHCRSGSVVFAAPIRSASLRARDIASFLSQLCANAVSMSMSRCEVQARANC